MDFSAGIAMDAIRVENLTKRFDDIVAVDAISFSVPEGELFGLLGPNGAGKTTTINMLATLLRPTSGAAFVAGHEVARERDAVRRCIGIVFQEPALDGRLTGRENLDFHGMMYGLERETRRRRIDEVLALVDLADRAGVLVDKYSGGMKRRLEIARGLIQRPRVLFLDEPTLGLDTQTRRAIWDYVLRLNREQGVTIILTTHYMEEADFLCSRIAIMDHGRFAALDSPANMKDLLGGDVVSLELAGRAEAVLDAVRGLPGVATAALHQGVLTITLEKAEQRIPELVLLAREKEATALSVQIHKPSLEDVFLHFTGSTIREREASLSEQNRFRVMGPRRPR